MVIKQCLHCGNSFSTKHKHLKYCSKICYWENRRKKARERLDMGSIQRGQDGSLIQIRPSNSSGHNIKIYALQEVACANCGKTIFREKSKIKKGLRFCCSPNCKKVLLSAKKGQIKYRRGKEGGHILECRPDHPHARKGYVPKHRLVMEEYIGRYLEEAERVHHIDFDPANNIISNLDKVSAKQHSRAQASLYKLVKQLLNLGVIHYNKEQHLYYLTKKGGK